MRHSHDFVERIFARVAATAPAPAAAGWGPRWIVSGINIRHLGQPIEHYGGKRVVRIWHRTLRRSAQRVEMIRPSVGGIISRVFRVVNGQWGVRCGFGH